MTLPSFGRIHFLSRDVARSFQSWLQSADEYLLPFIYKSVPELCGARTSTDPSSEITTTTLLGTSLPSDAFEILLVRMGDGLLACSHAIGCKWLSARAS